MREQRRRPPHEDPAKVSLPRVASTALPRDGGFGCGARLCGVQRGRPGPHGPEPHCDKSSPAPYPSRSPSLTPLPGRGACAGRRVLESWGHLRIQGLRRNTGCECHLPPGRHMGYPRGLVQPSSPSPSPSPSPSASSASSAGVPPNAAGRRGCLLAGSVHDLRIQGLHGLFQRLGPLQARSHMGYPRGLLQPSSSVVSAW